MSKLSYTRGSTVYLSIPMSGRTDAEIRAHADRLTAELKGMGLIVHDPTLTPNHKSCETCVDYRKTMMADLKALRQCDYIVLAMGWNRSFGCMIEITAYLAWKQCAHKRSVVFHEHPDAIEAEDHKYPMIDWNWEGFATINNLDVVDDVKEKPRMGRKIKRKRRRKT